MPVLTVTRDAVLLGVDAIQPTDTFVNGILTSASGGLNRAVSAGGEKYNNGLLMTDAGQIRYVDATAGLPVDTVWTNGLPQSGGALCISTGPAVTYSNGIPFAANGAVSTYGPITLSLDFLAYNALDSRITFTRADATPCATFFDSTGVLSTANANIPRFDYDPVTLAPQGLLIEESRTNGLLRSGDLAVSPWTNDSGTPTVTQNAALAPDGTTTATLIDDASTSAVLARGQVIAITSGTTTYTASVFLKASTSPCASVRFSINGGTPVNAEVVVNTATGAAQWRTGVTGVSFNTRSVGNGWWRVDLSITDNATGATSATILCRPAFAATYSSTLDLTATGSTLFWGAQLEVGAFATSYIPTATTALTRAADVAVMTGTNFSSWFNATEGTFVVEMVCIPGANNTGVSYAVSDNTFNNSIYGNFSAGNSYRGANVLVAGASQADTISTFTSVTPTNVNRDAFAYKANDFAESFNGTSARTDTAGSVPAVNRMYIGSNWSGVGNFLNGHIRRITYYPTRLTNAALQTLTT